MNAVGYTRISTKDQSNFSLENQERQIRIYCENNSLNLLAVFKDDGESSYTFDRPDWKSLERFLKRTSVEYLVILDHDRFSRNLAEALFKIKELYDKYGIKVLATTDNFNADFTDPSAFMMRAFKYMMAESELWNIRKRVKNGIVQAALNGRFTRKAPLGYTNAKDSEGKPVMVVDELNAEIVRTIFKEYLRGSAIEQIKKLVKPLGFRMTGQSAIQKILSNPVYAGLIKVPAHNGAPSKLVKGLHTPLINENYYWLAKERLTGKRRSIVSDESNFLKGVLRCYCGKPLTMDRSTGKMGKKYDYMVCKTHRKAYPLDKIASQFDEILSCLSLDKKTIQKTIKELKDIINENLSQRDTSVDAVKKSIKVIQNKIKTTEEKYLRKPDISETTFDKINTELKGEEAQLQMRLNELMMDEKEIWRQVSEIEKLLSDTKNTFYKLHFTDRQNFINMVFDYSLYYENGSYRTQFIHPVFSDKALILKEKGLLFTDDNVVKIKEKSPQWSKGDSSRTLMDFLPLFWRTA